MHSPTSGSFETWASTRDGAINMHVLIGCEFSGVVRRAFRARGHKAISCDLLPADDGEVDHHLQEDVLAVLEREWWHFDLAIFHPPCTRLANSGVRWLYGGKGNVPDLTIWTDMEKAAHFFRALLRTKIRKVAIENPIMHSHAVAIIGRRPTQIIQPWMFGHGETKATCLWLRNLPPLEPTRIVEGRRPRVHHESPGPDRWKRRSVTYDGIAAAMAEQWG